MPKFWHDSENNEKVYFGHLKQTYISMFSKKLLKKNKDRKNFLSGEEQIRKILQRDKKKNLKNF